MAPPTKRRKLSSPHSQNRHTHNSTGLDSWPSHEQAGGPPRVPHRPTPTKNFVHQEVKRAAVGGVEDFGPLMPRQGTGGTVSSAVPTSAVAGNVQVFTDSSTTLTYTPPALPTLPTLPSVPGATTFSSTTSTSVAENSASPDSYTRSSGNSSASSAAPTITASASASANFTTTAAVIVGNNSTATSRTTLTLITSSTSTFYYVTLDDGDVSTIAKSSSAFTTTVDGEVYTIPGYSDSQSRLQSSQTRSATETNGESTSASAATADATGAVGGAQTYGAPANTGADGPTSTGVDGSGDDGGSQGNDTPPAGTIAGGVVGGAAGLAVIVLIAMLFVRWYRRKSAMGHQALSAAPAGAPSEQCRSEPGMAERAGVTPFAAAVPALFQHQNRSTEPEQSERGFARISGRKLPSQWSEGMNSGQAPNMPLAVTTAGEESERNLSSTSFYRDSQGFYGGNGSDLSPSDASPESIHRGPLRTSDPGTIMMMSAGPERQPQVHDGGPYHFSRPGQASTSSTSPPGMSAGTLRRSETPSMLLDPNRSSRFTEDM